MAKVFAGIFMVVLVAGVVIYGYISMTRRQDLRRRERRAREWDDYEDDFDKYIVYDDDDDDDDDDK